MRKITWKLTGYESEATDDDIRQLEKKLNIKFPKEYVNIVKQYNEATPAQKCFDFFNPYKKRKFGSCLGGLISVILSDKFNIVKKHESLKNIHQVPDNIIPFGEVGNGDIICFDYRKSTDNPSIVYFAHDVQTDEEDTPALCPLANSFTEFLEMLHEPEDDEN